MATAKPDLKAILDKYGINANDRAKCWDCHGTLVLYHKAYEIIAAQEGITFDLPTIIEQDGGTKNVAILVVGKMKDRVEWSIGEASPLNYLTKGNQAAYPYAMAEKRGKDRVIAKLVGLAEHVYSEDEADEFKDAKPHGHAIPPPQRQQAPEELPPGMVEGVDVALILESAKEHKTIPKLAEWINENAGMLGDIGHKTPHAFDALAEQIFRYALTLCKNSGDIATWVGCKARGVVTNKMSAPVFEKMNDLVAELQAKLPKKAA